MTGLYARFVQWRNQRLADPRFQDWAASFPLTRAIARRRAREAFDLTAGFVYSQILYACVELDLFEALRAEALDMHALSARIGLPEEGAERLARAATALGLLEKRGPRYALGLHGAALLGNPSAFAMVRHHRALYEDLRDPVALLRERSQETALARFWNYGEGGSPAYSDLMAQTQSFISSEILHAYSFEGRRRLMDVAGGSGAFLCAAQENHPHLSLSLCELEHVAALARQRFAARGIDVDVHECDFRTAPLPAGADIISLVRVLHDHDDDAALNLLKAIRAALPENGVLLIAEPMARTRGAEAMGDAYFGFYLWAMGTGRPRALGEIRALARRAGFSRLRELRTRRPVLTRVVLAT